MCLAYNVLFDRNNHSAVTADKYTNPYKENEIENSIQTISTKLSCGDYKYATYRHECDSDTKSVCH